MYQNGWSIKKLLERVANNELLLPAIQREFVWKPEQICTLFDSIWHIPILENKKR